MRAIRIDRKKLAKMRLPSELSRYKKARIFQPDARKTLKPGQAIRPVVVGLEKDLLDKEEIAAVFSI